MQTASFLHNLGNADAIVQNVKNIQCKNRNTQGGSSVMPQDEGSLGLFQVLKSVMSSFIGVQNTATRERDFKRGRARDFILVGILLTVAFILAVYGLVKLVMHFATT